MRDSYAVDRTTLHQVPLRDLRTMDEVPNLETYGFTYVTKSPVVGIENLIEFSGAHQAALKANAVELVQKLTGSKTAIAFGGGYRDCNSPESSQSIRVIHSDMSPEGATWIKSEVQDLLFNSKDPREVEFGRHMTQGKDVVIYNVWRPLHTVQDNHLGFCRWDSLLKEDALQSHINPTKAGNALQPWRYREGQSWFFLSHQEPHEAFIFKQHDDRAKEDGHGINVPHASFTLKGYKGPSTRVSFEVKIIARIDPPIIKRIWYQLRKSVQSRLTKFNSIKSRNLEERKPR
ncbi:uncharacterized protein MELLADRAFT_69856 [Melampsora larici-populina 98AG31]|uniref:Uncharacterized protein n=1 Tax=Melampsora larici-populina (strain 98AG31 / pathotype 3-4-7) TaxID=747676 RepID=F4SCH6_MELLP|nr:uncharacterized protein MELLADRAFT_69856 [Melampsora larici-populina 98AG31]EGF97656.1 hypothetical protein MELLADRAFT_69856 [Melampsora larici-populina 98AG31]